MGLLRSTALEPVPGGYAPTCKGLTVNGVLLGEPILLGISPITMGWDDSALPSGEIDADGNVTPDEAEA